MAKTLVLTIADAKPLRHGLDYVWSLIIDLTRDGDTFLYRDLAGMCDQARLHLVRADLRRLEAAGFLDRLPAPMEKHARPYRLVKRQRETPSVRSDGASLGYQAMWNVMRRARAGFTVADLAIDASTDEVTVSLERARQYCQALERAGILKKLKAATPSYVLLGSANSGPKPPRRYRATLVFDENRGQIVGAVEAEEVTL